VLSGLSLWKPVQLDWLSALFGGFDFSRKVHFAAMTGIAAFVVVHVLLVAIVPKTLLPMVIGGGRIDESAT
jgi:thiosulfate reductase cytochrome b subunit